MSATAPDQTTSPSAVPAWLRPHRDLGPLEGALSRPVRLPLPQVIGAAVAVLLLVVPAVARTIGAGTDALGVPGEVASPVGPVWIWIAVAVAVATAAMAGRSLQRLDWPLPALLRAVEYGTVLLLTGASGWAYLLLAVLAAHHYGIVYRVRLSGTGSQGWLFLLVGGWPVRCTLLVVAAATGTLEVVVPAMVLYLGPLVAADALVSWRHLGR